MQVTGAEKRCRRQFGLASSPDHTHSASLNFLTLDTLPTISKTMSLDKNLFTLSFTPHQDNPNVIDLVDPSGTVHYRKQRVTGISEYKIELYGMSSIGYYQIA